MKRVHFLAGMTVALSIVASASAEARRYQKQNDTILCDMRGCSDWFKAAKGDSGERRVKQRKYTAPPARAMQIDKPQLYVSPDSPSDRLVTIQDYKRSVCTSNKGSTSLARVIAPLRAKAEEIVRECGAVIVSTDCRGGATPNHRNGLAVDIAMRGNASPACIYAKLKDWPGGVSTDYWTAPGTKHVHFSYSRKHEWGLRFAHSGGSRHANKKVRLATYQSQERN